MAKILSMHDLIYIEVIPTRKQKLQNAKGYLLLDQEKEHRIHMETHNENYLQGVYLTMPPNNNKDI